jgi:Spy/CpxP family protein refolding chaperone
MPVGRWWDNPALSDRIGLTEEQKKKMDDVFQASRIKLIDLRASLEKEEATLDPLMESATPDDSKLLPQIDRVAQARAELEKADARLLLGLRHVLSPQQWQTLQTERPIQARPAMSTRPGGDYNPPPAPSANPPARRGPGAPPSAPVTPPPGGRGNDQ